LSVYKPRPWADRLLAAAPDLVIAETCLRYLPKGLRDHGAERSETGKGLVLTAVMGGAGARLAPRLPRIVT
jgi:hypothetical protein